MSEVSREGASRGRVADRLFTADEVGVIVAWFGGDDNRWYAHVKADSDVVNLGMAPSASLHEKGRQDGIREAMERLP